MLKYESLILKPNKVQKKIADKFGLTIRKPFSECYQDFDQNDEVNMNTMNGARPLDPSRIGNWKDSNKKIDYVNRILANEPEVRAYMEKLGYS